MTQTKLLFLKPAIHEGQTVVVRKPDNPTAILPVEGAWVAPNPYWWRRLSEGSVTKSRPAKKQSSKKTAQKASSRKESDK